MTIDRHLSSLSLLEHAEIDHDRDSQHNDDGLLNHHFSTDESTLVADSRS